MSISKMFVLQFFQLKKISCLDGATTFTTTTLGITTFSIMTSSITTFSIMTLSIKGVFVTICIKDTQHNDKQYKGRICDTQHK
jgi:hypothetical protein